MANLKYKIFNGFDSFNNIDLYRVEGINNDYIGEWHEKDWDAFKEFMELKKI